MNARIKLFDKMKNNPKGCTLRDCQTVANEFSITHKHGKRGSHCYFFFPNIKYPIPANKKPINQNIARNFISLLEKLNESKSAKNN